MTQRIGGAVTETRLAAAGAEWTEFERRFRERGRAWAEKMLARLRVRTHDIPHTWPGTAEQARTIVNALTDEAIDEADRERLVAIVQSSARVTWRELAGDS